MILWKGLAMLALACTFAATASARGVRRDGGGPDAPPMAPWFDSSGFYSKPGVDLATVTRDTTVCRTEAARLRTMRNTHSPTMVASAFDGAGNYSAAMSGVATGAGLIMVAIQDASYNGSIERIEYRDCMVALGYHHFRLGTRARNLRNRLPDHGFASLITAQTPEDGDLNTAEAERNYYDSAVVTSGYQNAEPSPTIAAPAAAPQPEARVFERLAPEQTATPLPGMAIVVASARQNSTSMDIPIDGDLVRFRRVTPEGHFIDLLQPAPSFGVRSNFNRARRADPTLAGRFDAARYSTYQVPAGRYVLSDLGQVNTCLATLTFEIREGDVIYLGDFTANAPGVPMGSLLNPFTNLASGVDQGVRADLRLAIGDDLEGARQALQADVETRARLTRVFYQNGYRIPCDGRYIGRLVHPPWPMFSTLQASEFHDAFAASVAAAQTAQN